MMKIFAIRDRKAEVYGHPFFLRSSPEAIRLFGDEVNSGKEQSAVAKWPHDHELVELGTWDDQTGAITPDNRLLCSGTDVLKQGLDTSPQHPV